MLIIRTSYQHIFNCFPFILFTLQDTPLREPIDPLIREKIIEFSWKFGEGVLPTQIKDALESFVVNELFKGR